MGVQPVPFAFVVVTVKQWRKRWAFGMPYEQVVALDAVEGGCHTPLPLEPFLCGAGGKNSELHARTAPLAPIATATDELFYSC